MTYTGSVQGDCHETKQDEGTRAFYASIPTPSNYHTLSWLGSMYHAKELIDVVNRQLKHCNAAAGLHHRRHMPLAAAQTVVHMSSRQLKPCHNQPHLLIERACCGCSPYEHSRPYGPYGCLEVTLVWHIMCKGALVLCQLSTWGKTAGRKTAQTGCMTAENPCGLVCASTGPAITGLNDTNVKRHQRATDRVLDILLCATSNFSFAAPATRCGEVME